MNINWNVVICFALFSFLSSCGEPIEQDKIKTSEATMEQKVNTDTPKNNVMQKKIEVDPSVSIDRLMGKVTGKSSDDLVLVEKKFTNKPTLYVHKETYDAYLKMEKAAKEAGISLIIVSGFRSFNQQKAIWEAKWNGGRKVEGKDLSKTIKSPKERALKILEYSSMPGTSRHHWGTDIDINNLENSYFESGRGLKEYEWLTENAPKFGFCQTYTSKVGSNRTGYEEEKWHWSYLPIAKNWTEQYDLRIEDSAISGFDGAEAAAEIGIKQNYILGIHQSCL